MCLELRWRRGTPGRVGHDSPLKEETTRDPSDTRTGIGEGRPEGKTLDDWRDPLHSEMEPRTSSRSLREPLRESGNRTVVGGGISLLLLPW